MGSVFIQLMWAVYVKPSWMSLLSCMSLRLRVGANGVKLRKAVYLRCASGTH